MRSPVRSGKPFISLGDVSLRMRGGAMYGPIDWEILGDQHWAVVGPNGSGKSILVKAIHDQAPVAAGKITYHFLRNGASQGSRYRGTLPQDRIAYAAFDGQQAFVGHDSPFHQARWNRGVSQYSWPVSEYLSEGHVKRINPYQVVEERVGPSEFKEQREKVIEVLGLDGLLERDLSEISNGERRKVVLARALLRDPQLLILDNPFAGLDVEFRIRLKRILSSLMQDEMRIMLVTNGRDELPEDITHIMLLDREGAVASGPRQTILDRFPAQRELDQPTTAGTGLAEKQKTVDQTTDSPVLVQMDNVSVSYSGEQILEQVDWTVQQGENWAVLGPNGAGKTTLLSLILGDNPHAYANDISLFGKRRGSGESIWDIKRHVGWVAPELHLYYPRNVRCFDVVCSGFFASVGLHHRCSEEQCATAMAWMQRMGTSRYADMAFGRISEGEQRMILIARALVKRPRLLILDEPCQGLDAGNRDRVLQMIEAIGDHLNTSLIYVTHHRDALPKIITDVLRLDKGRVVGREKADTRVFVHSGHD